MMGKRCGGSGAETGSSKVFIDDRFTEYENQKVLSSRVQQSVPGCNPEPRTPRGI